MVTCSQATACPAEGKWPLRAVGAPVLGAISHASKEEDKRYTGLPIFPRKTSPPSDTHLSWAKTARFKTSPKGNIGTPDKCGDVSTYFHPTVIPKKSAVFFWCPFETTLSRIESANTERGLCWFPEPLWQEIQGRTSRTGVYIHIYNSVAFPRPENLDPFESSSHFLSG